MQHKDIKPLSLATRAAVDYLISYLVLSDILKRHYSAKGTLSQIRITETQPNILARQFLLGWNGETYLANTLRGISPEMQMANSHLSFFQKEHGKEITLSKVVKTFKKPQKIKHQAVLNNIVYNTPLAQALLQGHFGEEEMLKINVHCIASLQTPFSPLISENELTLDALNLPRPDFAGTCFIPNIALKQLLWLNFTERLERKYRIESLPQKKLLAHPNLIRQRNEIAEDFQVSLASLVTRLHEIVASRSDALSINEYKNNYLKSLEIRPGIDKLSTAELKEELQRYHMFDSVLIKQYRRTNFFWDDVNFILVLCAAALLVLTLTLYLALKEGTLNFYLGILIFCITIGTTALASYEFSLGHRITSMLEELLNQIILACCSHIGSWKDDIKHVLNYRQAIKDLMQETPLELDLKEHILQMQQIALRYEVKGTANLRLFSQTKKPLGQAATHVLRQSSHSV